MRKRMQAILAEVGDAAVCLACNAPIYWIRTRAGKLAPYSMAGVNHFADCPNPEQFRALGSRRGATNQATLF